jgi:hypothetical protein
LSGNFPAHLNIEFEHNVMLTPNHSPVINFVLFLISSSIVYL